MGKDVKILCDSCGRDLTTTGNVIDYRLVLANEKKEHHRGLTVVTDMMIYPPIDRTYYFCRIECLKKWLEKKEAAMQRLTDLGQEMDEENSHDN